VSLRKSRFLHEEIKVYPWEFSGMSMRKSRYAHENIQVYPWGNQGVSMWIFRSVHKEIQECPWGDSGVSMRRFRSVHEEIQKCPWGYAPVNIVCLEAFILEGFSWQHKNGLQSRLELRLTAYIPASDKRDQDKKLCFVLLLHSTNFI
jgi:hypothetical protein